MQGTKSAGMQGTLGREHVWTRAMTREEHPPDLTPSPNPDDPPTNALAPPQTMTTPVEPWALLLTPELTTPPPRTPRPPHNHSYTLRAVCVWGWGVWGGSCLRLSSRPPPPEHPDPPQTMTTH